MTATPRKRQKKAPPEPPASPLEPPAASGGRRDRERNRHRREILAAAVKLFSRRGFEKTTMADLAAEAEFAVGTLYKFFRDKQELYRTIIREIAAEMSSRLTETLRQNGTEIQRLHRYIDVKMELFVKHAPVGRLYFSQTTGAVWCPEATLDAELKELFHQTLSNLGEIFRRGIRKKLFVNRDPLLLALTLEGLTHAFIAPLVDNPQAFTAEEMASTIKGVFFQGILRDAAGRD